MANVTVNGSRIPAYWRGRFTNAQGNWVDRLARNARRIAVSSFAFGGMRDASSAGTERAALGRRNLSVPWAAAHEHCAVSAVLCSQAGCCVHPAPTRACHDCSSLSPMVRASISRCSRQPTQVRACTTARQKHRPTRSLYGHCATFCMVLCCTRSRAVLNQTSLYFRKLQTDARYNATISSRVSQDNAIQHLTVRCTALTGTRILVYLDP